MNYNLYFLNAPSNKWHKLRNVLHKGEHPIQVFSESWCSLRVRGTEDIIERSTCCQPSARDNSSSRLPLKGWNEADNRQDQVLVPLQDRPPWDTKCPFLCASPAPSKGSHKHFLLNFGATGPQDQCSNDICKSIQYFSIVFLASLLLEGNLLKHHPQDIWPP